MPAWRPPGPTDARVLRRPPGSAA